MKASKGTLPVDRMRGHMTPPPLPPPFEDVLPSGLVQKWRMPDPWLIVAFDGPIPDPLTAAVIDLLKSEKSYQSDSDPLRHRHESQNIKGIYVLGGAMAVDPVWDMSIEYGSDATLGRREIGYQDACALYHLFRFGTRQTPPTPPDPNEPERPADAPPDRDGIRTDASAAAGDS